jgi:hypothetical protein
VFGRAIAGQEVIKIVENELTDKGDKPFSHVAIANCGELIKKSAIGTTTTTCFLNITPSLCIVPVLFARLACGARLPL